MKKTLLIIGLLPILGFAQWSKTDSKNVSNVTELHAKTKVKNVFSLEKKAFDQKLANVPDRSSNLPGVIIELPNVKGEIERFEIWEYSNMAPELQAKYPQIRSYVGRSLSDPSAYLRFSNSPQGVSSYISRSGATEYLEPYTADGKMYIPYNKEMKGGKEHFECTTFGEPQEVTEEGKNFKIAGTNIYRLALSGTTEYGDWHIAKAGLPSSATQEEKIAVVLAAFNSTLTRLNGVYEKDLSAHYNLIAETESLIFFTGKPDNYSAHSPSGANTGINNTLNPNASTKYDLGHLIDKQSANGAAQLSVLCGGSKASGWTAHNVPEGSTFDIDYVAHEMGHQMGAGHTYTMYASQADRTVEPGSGSTIMAYTGIVGNLDVQYNSHDNYHYSSITQIKSKIASTSCAVNVPYSLPAPNLSAGSNYTIPKSAPFKVTATTTDTNTSAYTYTVEQIDLANSAQYGTNSVAYENKPTGPNFRALPQTSNNFRYLPDINTILSGAKGTRWESVTSVARDLNFGVVLRNNHPTEPNIAQSSMKVTVDANSGPFVVTSPTFGQAIASGVPFSVTWDVANTNVAPVNTTNVNIKFSKDGGQTFETIVANTPNDGSEMITLPANSTAVNAYIMIEPVGNIYYAVSPSFAVDYTINGESCQEYSYSGAPVEISDGIGGGGISAPRVEAPITISDDKVITKLSVIPQITHPNLNHLSIGLESPAGTQALLLHHQCSGTSGINATFDDSGSTVTCSGVPNAANTYKGFEALSVFKGRTTQGTWKLYASDNNPGSVGTIQGWKMNICTRDQVLGTSEVSNTLAQDIKVYPNPSNGNFFIKSRELTGNVEVNVFDMSGKKVHSSVSKQNAEQITKEYNLNLPKGVYMLTVKSDQGVYTQKLIIK